MGFAPKCSCNNSIETRFSQAEIEKCAAPPTPEANFQIRATSNEGKQKYKKSDFSLMWKSGHHRMCGNPYARVTIWASHSVPSVPPVDEKIKVAMTVTDAAIRKYMEFATLNVESKILDQKQLFIEKGSKSAFGHLGRPPGPKQYKTLILVKYPNGQKGSR